MAYVRVQKRGSRTYYYLVETKRKGKKVNQKVLRYLGTEKPLPENLEQIINQVKGEKVSEKRRRD